VTIKQWLLTVENGEPVIEEYLETVYPAMCCMGHDAIGYTPDWADGTSRCPVCRERAEVERLRAVLERIRDSGIAGPGTFRFWAQEALADRKAGADREG
jgi:microsomal dipeptidase-like Zn-dependent dipeptidase